MPELDDIALLRQYAAFAALAEKYVNLVYSTALRSAGNAPAAEEITQAVFIILARKARSLPPRTILSGWLYQTARLTAANFLRAEIRRQRREQEAYMQSLLNEPEPEVWPQIAPLLEAAMAGLGEKDRNAIVLRFFENKSLGEVGSALGANEAAAKMRVNRALEKLRTAFTNQGLTFSSGVIGGAISSHSVQAAPAGLAASVTSAVVHGAATSSTSTFIETTLKLMAWTKLKTTITLGAVALLVAGTVTVTHQRAKAKEGSPPYSFAGYATPEAAVQSMLWHANKGDLEGLRQGVTAEEMERFANRMAGQSPEAISRGLMAWAGSMSGYKVTEKEIVSADEVHLHIHAPPSSEGLHSGKVVLIVKKIGNEWKEAGDAN